VTSNDFRVIEHVDSTRSYGEYRKVQAGYAGERGMSNYWLGLYKGEPERAWGTGLRSRSFHFLAEGYHRKRFL